MKLLRNFGPIVIADTTSAFLGSIFWLYFASLLTVENFGEVQFLISIASMGVGIAVVANNNTIIVYEIKKKDLRSTLFLISFFATGVISIILFLIYSRIDIIFLTIGLVFGEMAIGYLLGKKLIKKYAIYIVLQKVLMLILGVGFYISIGMEGIIYGIALSYSILIVIVFRGFKESKINFSLLKNNYGFVTNNYGVRIIGISKKHLDKIFIAPIFGFQILGEYALAFQIYMIMVLFANISFKFLLLNDASGTTSKKLQFMVFLISIIISILGIVLFPMIIPIFFPNFIGIINIIPILSLAVIPYTIAIIFTSKFLGDEKGKFPLIGTVINIGIYLSMVIILGTTYGLMGLSLSFLISSIIYALFLIITYQIQKE